MYSQIAANKRKSYMMFFVFILFIGLFSEIDNRPRLQLLPRSQKISSPIDEKKTIEPSMRNSSIFGLGKKRKEKRRFKFDYIYLQ